MKHKTGNHKTPDYISLMVERYVGWSCVITEMLSSLISLPFANLLSLHLFFVLYLMVLDLEHSTIIMIHDGLVSHII